MEASFAATRLQAGLVGNYHPTVLQTTTKAIVNWRGTNTNRRRIRHKFPSQFSGGKARWILRSNRRTRNITPASCSMSERDGEIVSVQGSSFIKRAALWSIGLATEISNLVQSLGFTNPADKAAASSSSSSPAGVQPPHITPKPTRTEHRPDACSQASSATPAPTRSPSNFSRQSPIPSSGRRNEVRPLKNSEKSLDISAAETLATPTPKRSPSHFQRLSPIPSSESRRKERTAPASEHHQPDVSADAAVSFTPAPSRLPSRFRRQLPVSGLGVGERRERSLVGSSETDAGSNTEQASRPNADQIVETNPKISLPDRLPSSFVRLSPIDSLPKKANTSSASPTATVVSEILHELTPPSTQKNPTKKTGFSLKETKVVMEHIEAEIITVQTGGTHEVLGSYKLPELRSMAKARGLKGYSKLRKSELLELLRASVTTNNEQ